MTKLFSYKSYTVYKSSVIITFGNGKKLPLFQINDKNGNVIHRACQWGDCCTTKSDAKQRINKHIEILKVNEIYFAKMNK